MNELPEDIRLALSHDLDDSPRWDGDENDYEYQQRLYLND